MGQITTKLNNLLEKIPQEVSLVAVSKTKPNEDILEAYSLGQRIFGENKVQDLTKKYDELPKDIQWHFIGHLQTNKVKYLAPFISLVHSVDSLKLLKTINKEGAKNNRVINCLLQVKIADEDSKFGLSESNVFALVDSKDFALLKNVNVIGIMGMATNTGDIDKIKDEFKLLKEVFERLKKTVFSDHKNFEVLSMGMSHDYSIAIEQGSNMIRVGSQIFGERIYT